MAASGWTRPWQMTSVLNSGDRFMFKPEQSRQPGNNFEQWSKFATGVVKETDKSQQFQHGTFAVQ